MYLAHAGSAVTIERGQRRVRKLPERGAHITLEIFFGKGGRILNLDVLRFNLFERHVVLVLSLPAKL
jgi:hypothetical protein